MYRQARSHINCKNFRGVLQTTTAVTALVLLMSVPPSYAEVSNMPRTGAFAQPGPPTPKCDGIEDYAARYIEDAANYTAGLLERTATTLGNTLTGNPEALIDWVNQGWDDVKTGTTFATSELMGVVILEETFRFILPDSGIADFMQEGRKATGSATAYLAEGSMEVFEENVAEVSHDMWDIVENIDDPEALAASLGDKFQKWAPAGALTYLFTEGDPLKGAEKAAARLYKQAEILTLYVAPYAKAPAGMVNNSSRAWKAYNKLAKLPKGFPGPKIHHFGVGTRGTIKKHIEKALLRDFLHQGKKLMEQSDFTPEQEVAYASLLAIVKLRVEEGEVTGEHPFYQTRISTVKAEWMKDNHGDGGDNNWSLWHPKVENDSDCISLGDHTIADRGGHLGRGRTKLKAVCGPPSGTNGVHYSAGNGPVMAAMDTWWTRPIDYQLVWGDNCSGGTHDRSIWAPVCPAGYVGVGYVAWGQSSRKPLPNRIACLGEDPQLLHYVDGATAEVEWRTSDKGSGSKYDVTIYNRKFADMDLMYAVPGYPGSQTIDHRTVQLPVTWGVPAGSSVRENHIQRFSNDPVPPEFGMVWITPNGKWDHEAQQLFEERQIERAAAIAAAERLPGPDQRN